MNADRYLKIDELIDAALDVEPQHRGAFLDNACGNDSDLRAEVDSLLMAYDQAGDFIESPAMELAARSLAEDSILSLTGKTIGRYSVISLLGEGGMGEVYLANDSRLNRKIALKLLPAQFTQSPDRVARFQRESRAASALNHPNIITIYEIGQERGINFIASELVEGETLRRRINRGKLNLKEAIEIALQVASALAAAHSAGIVHRDIKPENIMIRRDGYVKVLDFGLAKLAELGNSDPNQSVLSNSTQAGTVLGTINYMSPEQARGQDIDDRTDIFSLGIVLYEMVTGHQPFKGATAASTFDAILNNPPAPIASSSPDFSTELVRIINRALEKDREIRYQTASDFRAELKHVQKSLDSQATASAETFATSGAAVRERVSYRWKRAAIALGVIAIVAPVAVLVGSRIFGRPSTSWLNAVATRLTSNPGLEYFPSLSPDGKSLVYASRAAGNFDIYLKRIGSRKTTNLTEESDAHETQPAFSPDGKRIAFRRTSREGGGIYVMTEAGESVKKLTEFGFNPAWSPDGKEIVCTENSVDGSGRTNFQSRMWIINSATGEDKELDVADAVQATWSPNGRRIAYWAVNETAQRDIWSVAVDGGQPVRITNDPFIDWNPVWSPDGEYLYFVSNRKGVVSLWRVAIDQTTGQTRNEPEPVPTPASETQHISFSNDGRSLAYVGARYAQNVKRLIFDPAKEKTSSTAELINSAGEATSAVVSPNGQVLACQSVGVQRDILSIKLGGSILNQLTDDEFNDFAPNWSPDGQRIAFFTNRSGGYQIWTINPDGSGARQITDATTPGGAVLPIWSPDGSRMAYSLFGGKSLIMDLKKAWSEQTPVDTALIDNREKTHFVASSWSPDGKYLAGSGFYDGRRQGLFAYAIDTQSYQMISDFGTMIKWLADSRRCLFAFEDRIFLTDTLSKKPREVFSFAPDRINALDVSKDNRYVYISITSTEADIWLLTLE